MDRIAAYLAEFDYKRASAKVYLSRLGRFSAFVSRGSPTMPIDQAVIDQFVDGNPTESPVYPHGRRSSLHAELCLNGFLSHPSKQVRMRH